MSKSKTKEIPDLDIPGLLALKIFERPQGDRVEKKIQNIMREVRTAHKRPSLLLFPDKSNAWMFAQPRYGVAALFLIFLGLHLLDRPMPKAEVVLPSLIDASTGADVIASVISTNRPTVPPVPGIAPAYQPVASDLATFVNYFE